MVFISHRYVFIIVIVLEIMRFKNIYIHLKETYGGEEEGGAKVN